MSEQREQRATQVPVSLSEMKAWPCINPCCHPDFVPPKPEEVKALYETAGWSQRQVALLAGVNYTEKGSPMVRRWRAPSTTKEHRRIPNGTWQNLLLCARLITLEEIDAAMKNYNNIS